jgi:hypothetical protein
MCLITLVQGFKLSVAKFDDFLVVNGLCPNEGSQPLPDEEADIAKLFKAKGVDCEVGIFVPHVTGFNQSQYLFVCYDWIHVLAAREIKGELQKPVPPAFEDMRRSLWAESEISKYVVHSDKGQTSWIPQELIRRHTVIDPKDLK